MLTNAHVPFDQPESYVNLPVWFNEANLPQLTPVKLVGNYRIGKVTDSTDLCIGEVEKTTKFASESAGPDETGTVRTFFRRVYPVIYTEAVQPGDVVRPTTITGAGKDVVIKWSKVASPPEHLRFGMGVVLESAVADGKGEVGIL